MEIIYFLIPLAMILLVAAVGFFLWAARSGQFEDLDREANRILFDEDLVKPKTPVERNEMTTPSSNEVAESDNKLK